MKMLPMADVDVCLTLYNDQLDVQIFLIHLLQSSTCTCFKQYLAHPRGQIILIRHLILSLSVSDNIRCRINII
jgi:hypothetical protein